MHKDKQTTAIREGLTSVCHLTILVWHIHGLRLNKGQTPARYLLGSTIMAHVWLKPDLRRAYQTEMP
jgi:hypothetical protein